MKGRTHQEAGKVSTRKDIDLDRELAALREPPSGVEFEANLHRALVQAGPPLKRRGWGRDLIEAWRDRLADRPMAVGILAGALATAACMLGYQRLAGTTLEKPQAYLAPTTNTEANATNAEVNGVNDQVAPGPSPDGKQVTKKPVTTLPKDKVALIRFEFHSEVSIEDAEFHIELPEGLVFWSEGRALADARFSWTGALEEGNNSIVTAVRASREGRYRVLATAWVEGEPLIHEVTLRVVEPGHGISAGGQHEG